MEEEISLRELIEVLLKGKKLIGIVTVVAVILSVIVSFMMSPVYEARTTLLANPIGSQKKEITDRNDVLDTISQYPEMTIETYKEQFLNSEVVQATIKELDLKDSEGNPVKIPSLRNKVSLEVIKDTNLIRVTVSDKDPELASNIANSLSKNFIDFITRMTKRKGSQAVEAITEQLESEKEALDKEAQKKRDYLMNSRDIDALNQEIGILRDQMTKYKQSLIDTDKQIQSDIKTLEELPNTGKSTVNIGEIKGKLGLDSVGQTSNISKEVEFDISNPSALQNTMLTAKRTEIETRLLENVSDKEVLQQKIEEIQTRLSDLRGTLATEEYKYNEVMRDYQLAEQSFQAYQTRKNEAEQNVAADIGKASIIVSSAAVVPDIPSGPNKKLNVAIGLVLGLMLGVFIAFFKAYWEGTNK